MADTGSLLITDLDFDQISANFVEFMSTQDYWKDYNFKASGLRSITDQLAYALHYGGFYGNMLGAESFLDSADLRSTIVSHAKSLSYLPKSVSASRAVVDITVSPKSTESMPGTLVLDKGTAFTCSVTGEQTPGDNGITFSATQTYVSTVDPGQDHTFEGVELRQGRYRSFDWVVDSRDTEQRFVLPHSGIDVSLLEVYVQEGTDDTRMARYSFADDVVDVGPDDRAYYLEETEDARFRIYFGDGILGKAVGNGKVVRAIYFETAGSGGNGFDSFALTNLSDLTDHRIDIVTTQLANGGADAETKESIKFNSPRSFSTRKRALSNDDWGNVTKGYSDVRDVKVWGGEDEDAPLAHFGNVYLSINPVSGAVLSQRRKDEIVADLKANYRGMGVSPIIVDPERIWALVDAKIFVDQSLTFGDLNSLKKVARDAALKYSADNLETFNGNLELSRLSRSVDDSDQAITSSLLRVRLQTRLTVNQGTKQEYSFNFKNAIAPGTIFSNVVTIDNQQIQIDDDGVGNLRFYRTDSGSRRVVNSVAGTVNYADGSFTIGAVRIQKADPTTFDLRIGATPAEQNVTAKFNKIVMIDPDSIRVTVAEESNK